MERRTRTLLTVVSLVVASVGAGGLVAGTVAGDATGAVSDATGVTTEVSGVAADGSAVQPDCSFPATLTDVTGQVVTLEERPERIVVLQPSDAQIVWEIGARDRVVGMPQGPTTAYLNDTGGITDVKTDDGTVDVEVVTDLNADVVIAANVTQRATIQQLRNTGTPVYHFGQVESMAATYRNINRTGQLVGNCEGAAETVGSMQARLDRIQQAVAGEDRPNVLYAFYGYTAGNATHVDSMIELAGGENIVATFGLSGYPEINREMIVANEPQWIVHPSDAAPPSGAPYNGTTAVERDQVLEVNANFANQAGPRTVDVVATMAQAFHPEAFDEDGDPIVGTATPTGDTAEPGATATDSNATETATTATTTPTDESEATPTVVNGPGFTAITVVVALAAALALGVRRKGV